MRSEGVRAESLGPWVRQWLPPGILVGSVQAITYELRQGGIGCRTRVGVRNNLSRRMFLATRKNSGSSLE